VSHKLCRIRSRSSRATQCSAVNSGRLHRPAREAHQLQRRLRQELANQETSRTADPAIMTSFTIRRRVTFDGWLQSSRGDGTRPDITLARCTRETFGRTRNRNRSSREDLKARNGAIDKRDRYPLNSITAAIVPRVEQQTVGMSRACGITSRAGTTDLHDDLTPA